MEGAVYKRLHFNILLRRLGEPRRFIQVLAGPRQTGKTTVARQVTEAWSGPSHFASADAIAPPQSSWIEQQWELGRRRAREAGGEPGAILVLDEVQKVERWSDRVKMLWDADTASGLPLRVVLLGSSPWLVRRGLGESLAGRFEVIPVMHWSFAEMRDAFDWDLDRFVAFGGYPGAAPLADDRDRWASYVADSLVETTLSRDVLLMSRVDKPALLRQLFHLACRHSGEILSYNKMLGQLQDAGNTTTLAHYLHLLAEAGLFAGVPKFAGNAVRQRASSPKLVPFNTALVSAGFHRTFEALRADGEAWGRLVESAVGAHLLNEAASTPVEVFYWRDRAREVDFVLRLDDALVAIEVKSGRKKDYPYELDAFARAFQVRRALLVGPDGIPVEEFLSTPLRAWVDGIGDGEALP
jgi:hypothetical protein